MIEPLRNMEEFVSRDEAEAARLLRTLGPAAPLPAVEQRVFTSLGKPARLAPRALHMALVTSVSVVTTGILAMTVGLALHRNAETRVPALSEPPPPAPAVAPILPAEPQPAPVMSPEPASPPRPEARRFSRSVAPRNSVDERHRTERPTPPVSPVEPVPTVTSPTAESVPTRVAAAPPEEAALVLAGLRALRRQHDPAQAGALLSGYLSRFPQGALVQEALAISIEASLARGDQKVAAQLAGQYLDRFPAGRFVRLARKAADGTGP